MEVKSSEGRWGGGADEVVVVVGLGLSTSLDPRVSHAFISLFITSIPIQ